MSRSLVVLDADSTLLRCEAIELLAAAAGSFELVAAVTERAMRGELDFAASLRERVATLRGLPISELDTVRSQMQLTEGAQSLVDGVHAAGGLVGVVSGGFHELLDPIVERIGIDFWLANRLGVHEGELTGEVEGEIVDAAAKARSLLGWAKDAGIPADRTVAVGDGANDLEMMAEARLAVAFHAKPRVRDRANVVIDRPDLAQVLPLLGLRG